MSKPVSTARAALRGPFGLVLLSHSVVIALLVGLVISALTSWLAHRVIQRDEEQRFEMARQEVSDLVKARFGFYLGVLQHTRAFLTTKERFSRQDFRVFLQSVDYAGGYPDILGVAFADRISAANRAAHEREVREDGYPRYRIWPRTPRSVHIYPVKFIEPYDARNQNVLGFDLHSESRRAQAMDRARDGAEPTLTAALQLNRDLYANAPPGFLLMLPVYQRGLRMVTVEERRWALRGFIFLPFRAVDFFSALTRSAGVFREGVGLHATSGGVPLFDSGAPAEGSLRAVTPLPIFGQTWSLEVYATTSFASPADRYAPLFVFVTGLLITLLACWVAYATDRHSASQLEAIALRDEFLSICSHELRTPLTSMKLQNQLVQRTLHDDLAQGNTSRFEKMVQQSGRQIDRLVRLVEEMLDISRIRSGKLNLAPENLDLSQLVVDGLERFGPQLQAAGSKVLVSVPDSLRGRWDRLRLEQVLVNLLSNALKYGAGKPLRVELRRQGEKAVLSVADEGIGIATEHQERIFERFERAAAKSEIGGLGLGLYIAKQILELQGGSIRVESRLGEGSRFVVELPLNAEEKVELPLNAEEKVELPLNAEEKVELPLNASNPVEPPRAEIT